VTRFESVFNENLFYAICCTARGRLLDSGLQHFWSVLVWIGWDGMERDGLGGLVGWAVVSDCSDYTVASLVSCQSKCLLP